MAVVASVQTAIRRAMLAIPVVALFLSTGVIFLAAQPPRTWASNWSTPSMPAGTNDDNDFGAVARSGGAWDLLWTDSNHRLLFTRRGAIRPVVLDRGEVSQPTLIAMGYTDLGLWIRDDQNGTDLREALLRPGHPPGVRTVITGAAPMEHPYLFRGPRGAIDAVFSWQRFGNFDVYLLSLDPGTGRVRLVRRLTESRVYAFYPRATTDQDGDIEVLYLDRCCQQLTWNIEYGRYDALGRPDGPATRIDSLQYTGQAPDLPQWGEDLQRGPDGRIWGAYTGLTGIMMFEANRAGRIVRRPVQVDGLPSAPQSASIAAGQDGGYLFWEGSNEIGTFIQSRSFDRNLVPGAYERVEYTSGTHNDPHAAMVAGAPQVIWQTITPDLSSVFESSRHRASVAPDLVQRLGLGLGNPWEEVALLLGGAIALATVCTSVNILIVVLLAVAGALVMRLLRRLPGRWALYGLLLTLALYATFVSPGVPTFFLVPIPSLGLHALPFGAVAAVGALTVVTWVGYTALRRLDDIYRAVAMSFLGVYFFAFLETALLIQKQLGYV